MEVKSGPYLSDGAGSNGVSLFLFRDQKVPSSVDGFNTLFCSWSRIFGRKRYSFLFLVPKRSAFVSVVRNETPSKFEVRKSWLSQPWSESIRFCVRRPNGKAFACYRQYAFQLRNTNFSAPSIFILIFRNTYQHRLKC